VPSCGVDGGAVFPESEFVGGAELRAAVCWAVVGGAEGASDFGRG